MDDNINRQYFLHTVSDGDEDVAIIKTMIDALDRSGFWNDTSAIILNIEEKCFAFITFKEYAYLQYIFTKYEHRMLGLASYMMDLINKEASRRNIDKLAFFSREETVSFYERLGYEWVPTNNGVSLYYGSLNKELLTQIPPELEIYLKNEKS